MDISLQNELLDLAKAVGREAGEEGTNVPSKSALLG